MRNIAVLLLFFAVPLAGEPVKKTRPATVAPEALPHQIALFLSSLSSDGKREVTFKAAAVGTRFFFEENSGVTVYRFDNGRYVREEFLGDSTLSKAVKRYEAKETAELR